MRLRRRPRRERPLDEEWRSIRRGDAVVYALLVLAALLVIFSALPLGVR